MKKAIMDMLQADLITEEVALANIPQEFKEEDNHQQI